MPTFNVFFESTDAMFSTGAVDANSPTTVYMPDTNSSLLKSAHETLASLMIWNNRDSNVNVCLDSWTLTGASQPPAWASAGAASGTSVANYSNLTLYLTTEVIGGSPVAVIPVDSAESLPSTVRILKYPTTPVTKTEVVRGLACFPDLAGTSGDFIYHKFGSGLEGSRLLGGLRNSACQNVTIRAGEALVGICITPASTVPMMNSYQVVIDVGGETYISNFFASEAEYPVFGIANDTGSGVVVKVLAVTRNAHASMMATAVVLPNPLNLFGLEPISDYRTGTGVDYPVTPFDSGDSLPADIVVKTMAQVWPTAQYGHPSHDVENWNNPLGRLNNSTYWPVQFSGGATGLPLEKNLRQIPRNGLFFTMYPGTGVALVYRHPDVYAWPHEMALTFTTTDRAAVGGGGPSPRAISYA